MKSEYTEQTEMSEEKPKEKKVTKVVKWFNEYCTDNKSDIKMICDLVARSVEDQFNMSVASNNTELFALMFFVTFTSVLDFLKKKQSQFDNFSFEICNSINIGYTNNIDESNEKVGNFMPIIEYISINRNIIRDDDTNSDDSSTVNFIHWKQQNLRQNENFCNQIQDQASVVLTNEYGIRIANNECIIPIFCIFLDMIVQVLKLKFQEAMGTNVSEVSMNILGLFTAYYSFNEEDNEEIIEYIPGIYTKLRQKSDINASRD